MRHSVHLFIPDETKLIHECKRNSQQDLHQFIITIGRELSPRGGTSETMVAGTLLGLAPPGSKCSVSKSMGATFPALMHLFQMVGVGNHY